jgi:7,8-dihydroneopterin aldolase/epimerase/oxygenase
VISLQVTYFFIFTKIKKDINFIGYKFIKKIKFVKNLKYKIKMGIIKLENIRTFSFHGCLEEESKIGSNYRVDLEIKTDLRLSSITDVLKDTVDYVLLNQIVVEQMAIRANLLEHVAQRIVDEISKKIPVVKKVKIKVSKINPPIGGDVEMVGVVIKKRIN